VASALFIGDYHRLRGRGLLDRCELRELQLFLRPLPVLVLFLSALFFPLFGHQVAVLVADVRRPTACVGLHLLPLLAGDNRPG
jgi:hypothetical protein